MSFLFFKVNMGKINIDNWPKNERYPDYDFSEEFQATSMEGLEVPVTITLRKPKGNF